MKSRRERSRAVHLVADGLVLEPRLVQDLLQLLVVEVGHPDGLGQPCIFSRVWGQMGAEKPLGTGNRTRINAEKNTCKKCLMSIISIDFKKEKRRRGS